MMMRIGAHCFSMKRFENEPAEKIQALAEALQIYAQHKQEVENHEASLRQFITEQIKFLEDDYNCEITFNGIRMDSDEMKIKFKPSF